MSLLVFVGKLTIDGSEVSFTLDTLSFRNKKRSALRKATQCTPFVYNEILLQVLADAAGTLQQHETSDRYKNLPIIRHTS